MSKEDIVASFFVKIARIRDDILSIDEIVPDKELVITTILGLPPTWGAFAAGLNSWKVAPTFEELWTACSQEELRISLVDNPEGVSNAYTAHHKRNFKKSKGPKRKVDMSKVECYQCHKKGHYRGDCLDNPRNKKREKDQANIAEEEDLGKAKPKESDIRNFATKSFAFSPRHSILNFIIRVRIRNSSSNSSQNGRYGKKEKENQRRNLSNSNKWCLHRLTPDPT